MKDFQNAKIYKIVGNGDLTYYGSTCCKLSERLARHRNSFKQYLNGKASYITSFELLKEHNEIIVLVENFPCENNDELLARERYYIENYNCVNKVIPNKLKSMGRKAYQHDYMKAYIEANKEYLKGRQQEKVCCELCNSFITRANINRHRGNKKCMTISCYQNHLLNQEQISSDSL